MSLSAWLTIVSICLLGAMSPGPSLAVILRHTLRGGRRNGYLAALAHGFGISLYALLCISGLAFVITTNQALFEALQWAGAAYLLWLGYKGLTARPGSELPEHEHLNGSAVREGFLVVFLNPKIAVFFIALFSQVIGPETSLTAKLVYATTAAVIDAGWYLLVAWLMSAPRWLDKLQKNAVWLERIFGVVLIALAGRLILQTLSGS
jgi:threonine/homoserine/homoserine lactone efflux protein